MRTPCVSFLFITLFILLLPTLAAVFPARAEEPSYLEKVLESAHVQKLSDDPYWHILLHYRKGLTGYESMVDDPRFFLAPEGKSDPEAELDATIRSFFMPQADDKDATVCRFVARFEWLKERLHIDPAFLPIPECSSFMDLMSRIRPESATLIFPMAHLNSPASMFGHTLLTIDTADKTKLLAYSVSYSAFSNETFGPSFAFKGLLGYYPGYFSVLPYYLKLQEYNDVDHRDIWEYPLNLTGPEISRMMLHIREMDSIASDYYFFDENCSYVLFYLLEAARPSVRFTDKVHGWLIPLDSVRMIEEQGMITGTHYRPSRTTRIKYLMTRVPEHGQDTAMALVHGRESATLSGNSAADPEQAKILELASEYLQYLYTRHAMPEKTYQERFLRILKDRSRFGAAGSDIENEIPVPARPDQGHRSNRISLGYGIKRDKGFQEIRLRPAYHGIMDNDAGYVEGAQLIFADLSLRHHSSKRPVTLDALDIIDIISLTPRDRLFQPVSWKIATGLWTMDRDSGHGHRLYRINPGGGVTARTSFLGLTYAMMETQVNLGGSLDKGYNLGAGGSMGVLKTVAGIWKLHAYTRDLYYCLGDTFNAFEAGLQQNLSLTPDQNLALDIVRQKTHDYYQTEVKASWKIFF